MSRTCFSTSAQIETVLTERTNFAGVMEEEEVLRLATEVGLNEKAFAEGLQSPETASLASGLAAVCRCRTLLVQLINHFSLPPERRIDLTYLYH